MEGLFGKIVKPNIPKPNNLVEKGWGGEGESTGGMDWPYQKLLSYVAEGELWKHLESPRHRTAKLVKMKKKKNKTSVVTDNEFQM